jgi:hypothetical protein
MLWQHVGKGSSAVDSSALSSSPQPLLPTCMQLRSDLQVCLVRTSGTASKSLRLRGRYVWGQTVGDALSKFRRSEKDPKKVPGTTVDHGGGGGGVGPWKETEMVGAPVFINKYRCWCGLAQRIMRVTQEDACDTNYRRTLRAIKGKGWLRFEKGL